MQEQNLRHAARYDLRQLGLDGNRRLEQEHHSGKTWSHSLCRACEGSQCEAPTATRAGGPHNGQGGLSCKAPGRCAAHPPRPATYPHAHTRAMPGNWPQDTEGPRHEMPRGVGARAGPANTHGHKHRAHQTRREKERREERQTLHKPGQRDQRDRRSSCPAFKWTTTTSCKEIAPIQHSHGCQRATADQGQTCGFPLTEPAQAMHQDSVSVHPRGHH